MPLLLTAPATTPAVSEWLLPASLFRLLVMGSIIGLAMATLVIVLIWLREWRQGKVW